MKTALIFGIGGQDGSYLADHLFMTEGYKIHGVYRRSSADNLWRIKHLTHGEVTLHEGDLCDPLSVHEIIQLVAPDEIYNLADQDHVGSSFNSPTYSLDVTAGGPQNIFESTRGSKARIFQPISATVFGRQPWPQTLETILDPLSPYAVAKAHAWLNAKYYRECYGRYVSCGVLYNHDSIRRQGNYLLHHIARQLVDVVNKVTNKITIANPDMHVDIGYASEFVIAMHQSLQKDNPSDYIICSGHHYSIRDVIESGSVQAGLYMTHLDLITDPSLLRPYPTQTLIGSATNTAHDLGWKAKTDAYDMVKMLVRYYLTKRRSCE